MALILMLLKLFLVKRYGEMRCLNIARNIFD